jgi:hypothetical protein
VAGSHEPPIALGVRGSDGLPRDIHRGGMSGLDLQQRLATAGVPSLGPRSYRSAFDLAPSLNVSMNDLAKETRQKGRDEP